MSQLRVIKSESGEPSVKCPRCDETIVPVKNALFADYDCPECQAVIDSGTLRRYSRELKRYLEGGDDEKA